MKREIHGRGPCLPGWQRKNNGGVGDDGEMTSETNSGKCHLVGTRGKEVERNRRGGKYKRKKGQGIR